MPFTISCKPNKVTILENFVFTLEITSTVPLEVGTGFYMPFYLKPWEGLMEGLNRDKNHNNLVQVTRSDMGGIRGENRMTNPDFAILSDLWIFIEEKPLKEGEKVILTFGSKDQPVHTLRKQQALGIELFYHSKQEQALTPIPVPSFQIDSGKAEKLFARGPSIIKPGEEAHLVIYAEDSRENVVNQMEGTIYIDNKAYPAMNLQSKVGLPRYQWPLQNMTPGVHYIKVRYQNLETLSNPIWVTNKEVSPLFWGDLHVHSQVSDGRGEIDDVLEDAYRRGLDFIAVADHAFGREERGHRLERLKKQCSSIEKYSLSDFVPLFAGETHYLDHIHLNMYFNHNNSEKAEFFLRELEKVLPIDLDWKKISIEEKQQILKGFWNRFDKLQAQDPQVLVFFHHTMWLGGMEYFHKTMRLIEMVSIFGSSETREQKEETEKLQMMADRLKGEGERKNSVREALNQGYKLGFVGGSDNHDGQGGKNALTAIQSDSLTRESLWQGLYQRRTYATNAHKTLLQIEKSGNKWQILVAPDGVLAKIDLIADGKVVKSIRDFPEKIFKALWEIPGFNQYCYIRVQLKSGDTAWSQVEFSE